MSRYSLSLSLSPFHRCPTGSKRFGRVALGLMFGLLPLLSVAKTPESESGTLQQVLTQWTELRSKVPIGNFDSEARNAYLEIAGDVPAALQAMHQEHEELHRLRSALYGPEPKGAGLMKCYMAACSSALVAADLAVIAAVLACSAGPTPVCAAAVATALSALATARSSCDGCMQQE